MPGRTSCSAMAFGTAACWSSGSACKLLSKEKKEGVQWVFKSNSDVKVFGFWMFMNSPPNAGEERMGGWDPELEVLPPMQEVPPIAAD